MGVHRRRGHAVAKKEVKQETQLGVTTACQGRRTTDNWPPDLVTQFRFPLGGGRQGILFLPYGTRAGLLHPPGLRRVEFNVRLKLGRNLLPGVDGVHWTYVHAS